MNVPIDTKLNLYKQDYVAWLDLLAEQIKQKKTQQIDWENLLEEIVALGNEQRRKTESYLRQLLKHLLLYAYWTSEKVYSGKGWEIEIINFRAELANLLESKTLYNHAYSRLDKVYQQARKQAALKSDLHDLPIACPWSISDILDENFLP
ncbi:protein of unknown function DUF29 [Stanieria cyanosphaera PCC 7437]|uniref:DUF29 domain-containing protein n=1 Tax=Stanieria cyanosphaera (strain ATCC 29371 / PCC 7437) TaxID=111780 RepID=K9XR83_STAC7|nr:DUF29 domain-containing protein [Stanieria cyanosphaera]AFZ35120.1 protein of unknown function DUF29 [Stanieria cyanosphaera PCC 7437]